jgi:pyruvate kinase
MKPRARRTKIIATLGPATDNGTMLYQLIKAGVDVVRLNFSHGKPEHHLERAKKVREIAKELGREVAVLVDLQGPKIRIASFEKGEAILRAGERFILDASLGDYDGDDQRVGIDYKQLPQDVHAGDTLLIDDGAIVLRVVSVNGASIETLVVEGGVISNNKGINRLGGGLSAASLTEKDIKDIKTAAQIDADYIAVSFVRSAADILQVRDLIKQNNFDASVVAKIERAEALKVLDSIIEASDAVMVARGDLGVEIGDSQLPSAQKKIIQRARALNKIAITATQMMQSMIHNPIPTRAEVFDVANAILDGTDAVMLSAETASGDYPEKVVDAVVRACLGAEQDRNAQISKHRLELDFTKIDEAIAMATMYTANHLHVQAIVALTESGSTPLLMSRIRSGIPIFALCRHEKTRSKMALMRGVYPIAFDVTKQSRDDLNPNSIAELENRNLVKKDDTVILTKGDYMGVHGGTNAMKVVKVGAVV